MKHYSQLTQEQRYHIYGLIKSGDSLAEIAEEIGVHKSTVSRELSRNSGKRGYRPKQAHEKAEERKKTSYKPKKMTANLIELIEERLRLYWSPEQISGELALNHGIQISHESIYQYILQDKKNGGELYTFLRHSGKQRKKRYGSKSNRGKIPNKKSIDERPEIVDEKSRIGDWEIDTVIGKSHKRAFVTVVERISSLVKIKKVETKQAGEVTAATTDMLSDLGKHVHTITADNGKEFSGHEIISSNLDCDFYFAHPYSSWERGLNEYTNKLIRQFFPKGSDFDSVKKSDVSYVENLLNNRPRKKLGYKTPLEVFNEMTNTS